MDCLTVLNCVPRFQCLKLMFMRAQTSMWQVRVIIILKQTEKFEKKRIILFKRI